MTRKLGTVAALSVELLAIADRTCPAILRELGKPIYMAILRAFKNFVRGYAPRSLLEWRQRRSTAQFATMSPQDVFRDFYRTNTWGDRESVSGPGSTMEATAIARKLITEVVQKLNCKVFHDIPCGDFHWMQHVDFGACRYIGSDIVPELVESNNARYASANREFAVRNLISDSLPAADVVLVRDCFIHLSFNDGFAALRSIKASGSVYLLTNTYPDHQKNYDTNTGGARPVNFALPPFGFPEPLKFVTETVTLDPLAAPGKTLVLYRIAELPDAPRA